MGEKKPRLFYDRGDVLELVAASPDDLDHIKLAGLSTHLRDFMECAADGEEARIVMKLKTDEEVDALFDL